MYKHPVTWNKQDLPERRQMIDQSRDFFLSRARSFAFSSKYSAGYQATLPGLYWNKKEEKELAK